MVVALLDEQLGGTATAQSARVLEQHFGVRIVHLAQDDYIVRVVLVGVESATHATISRSDGAMTYTVDLIRDVRGSKESQHRQLERSSSLQLVEPSTVRDVVETILLGQFNTAKRIGQGNW